MKKTIITLIFIFSIFRIFALNGQLPTTLGPGAFTVTPPTGIWLNVGTSCTILPGTTLLFQTGTTFTINGTLIADGGNPNDNNNCTDDTWQRIIRFLPFSSTWGGIIITYTGDNTDYTILHNCEITGVQNNPAITTTDAGTFGTIPQVTIYCSWIHDNISYNYAGGIACTNTKVHTINTEILIETNIIERNICYNTPNNYTIPYIGGIYYNNNLLSFQSNVIQDNHGDGGLNYIYAGGIYGVGSQNCLYNLNTIIGNSSHGDGGGIYLNNCTQTMVANDIEGNTAFNNGGGIYYTNGTGDINGNIHNNIALWGSGGGIYYNGTGNIHDCGIIDYNTAYQFGGGIYYNGTGNIYDCNINNNTSIIYDGGGIWFKGTGLIPSYIYNNTISSNTAQQNGGGMFCDLNSNIIIGTYNVNNTTSNNIYNNIATIGSGGGIYLNGCKSSLVADNFIYSNFCLSSSSGGGGIEIRDETWDNHTVIISGDSIKYNHANSGGGIDIYAGGNASTIIENCHITHHGNVQTGYNTIQQGGGINIASNGNVNINYTEISNNTVNLKGGGICITGITSTGNPTETITGNLIRYNTVLDENTSTTNVRGGGGIFISDNIGNQYPALNVYIINNNSIINNNAITGIGCGNSGCSGRGGGISVYSYYYYNGNYNNNLFLNINNNTNISNNNAQNYGGGIFITDNPNTLNITYNTINSNSSNYGGGIAAYNSNTIINYNNSISTNQSNNQGGGLWLSNCNGSITGNTTIDHNTSISDGGGIWLSYCDLLVSGNSISVNSSGNDGSGIYLENQATNASFFSNTIFNNHSNNNGGGMYIYNSTSGTLELNEIYENTSNYGGGIFSNNSSNLNINLNTLFLNVGNQDGGGLYFYYSSNINENGNNISSNSAYNGGGIYVNNSNVVITQDVIWSNYTIYIGNGNGGGIYYNGSYGANISECDISFNTSANNGGGIYCTGINGTINILLNRMIDNTALNGDGGGIYFYNNSSISLNIINNLIANCTSSNNNGGGIYLDIPNNSNLIANSNTIVYNFANNDGGGIYLNGPTAFGFYGNNILWGNWTPTSWPLTNSANGILYAGGNYTLFTYCDIDDMTGTPSIGTINQIPYFASITPPYDYRAHAFLYPPNSPVIDAGNDTYYQTNYDLDGYTRIIPLIVSTYHIDMGAYENNGNNPNIIGPLSINKQNNNNEDASLNIYPNPFKDRTNINFYVPDNSEIRIEIYDMQGKSIDIVTDKVFTKGNYNLSWNNNNLSYGIYICKMTINYNKILYEKLIIE